MSAELNKHEIEIQIFIKNATSRSNFSKFKYSKLEDLFFTLMEIQNEQSTISSNTYKKLYEKLILELFLTYQNDKLQKNDENSTYGYLISQKEKKILIDCMDIFLESCQSNFIQPQEMYYMFYLGGEDFMKKHNFNINTQSFIYEKFKHFIEENISIYNKKTHNRINHYCTHDFYNTFLGEVKNISKELDVHKIKFLEVNKWTHILTFAAYVHLGFEPSRKDSIQMFENVWKEQTVRNINEISFFCDTFSKTNFFRNTFAPTKKIKIQLNNFFKDYFEPNELKKTHFLLEPIAELEDKKFIFLNHPSFLQENIQKRFTLKQNQIILGKKFVSKNEEELVEQKLKEKEAIKSVTKFKI